MLTGAYGLQAAALNMPLNRDFEDVVHEVTTKTKTRCGIDSKCDDDRKGFDAPPS